MLRVHGVYLLESEEFPISVMVSPASFLVFSKGTSDVQQGYGCGTRRYRRPAPAAGCHRPRHHQAREGAQGQGQEQGHPGEEGELPRLEEAARWPHPPRYLPRSEGCGADWLI